MKILLTDIVESDILAFHEEGLSVFPYLEKAINNNTPIEISFEGITMCATQFLHSSIGKLYLQYPLETIEKYISINYSNTPLLKEKIEKVRWSALNSSLYDKLISNETSIQ